MVWTSPYEPIATDPATLPQLVVDQAQRTPGRPALIGDEIVTYAELAQRIRGWKLGGTVAVQAPNSPRWAATALGVMAAGGRVTGVSPLATDRERAAQLGDAGATALVTATEVARLGDAASPGGDVALLPYSSGTTGLPKGVMLTHANLVASVRQLDRLLRIDEHDVVLAVAPFAHVMGFVVTCALPLTAGATVVTMPRFDLRQMLALIERHRVTVLVIPPPVMSALARADGHDLSSLELVVSGGAPLGAERQRAVAARFPHAAIGQGYGLTETSVGIAGPDRVSGSLPGSAGRLVPSTELRVVDGELWVRGPQNTPGYLGNPRATSELIDAEGWLHTGDLGHVDADGNVFVVDRLKELIKVNGHQVAPAELEALLATHPQVADAAVVRQPDDRRGEVPVAVVVPRGDLDPDALMTWVADRVSPYKRIRAVRTTDSIPRTPAGKILRRYVT